MGTGDELVVLDELNASGVTHSLLQMASAQPDKQLAGGSDYDIGGSEDGVEEDEGAEEEEGMTDGRLHSV